MNGVHVLYFTDSVRLTGVVLWLMKFYLTINMICSSILLLYDFEIKYSILSPYDIVIKKIR